MKIKTIVSISILIILIITYTSFYDFVPTQYLFEKLKIIFYPIIILICYKEIIKAKGDFVLPMKLILLSFLVSTISSHFFWNQSFIDSFKAIGTAMSFLLFFLLIKLKIKGSIIIKIVLFFSYLYVILFLYQMASGSQALFGYWDELSESRGVIRIIFPGEGFLFFALFYYISRMGKDLKLEYVLPLILFVVVMFMQATRIYILAFAWISIFHFIAKSKVSYKIITILACFGIFYFYTYSDNSIIKGIRESNVQDSELKEDYIRVQAGNYFLFELSPNFAASILGNGMPFPKSTYGKKIAILSEYDLYFLDDLGLISGYTMFGALFVIGYLLIFFYSIKIPLPLDKIYLKYYLWGMITMSLTTRAMYNGGFVVITSIVIYLYYIESRKRKITNFFLNSEIK